MNDDQLLARLKSIDAARTSHVPAPELDRLLEATVSARLEPGPRPVSSPARRRSLWLAAVAVAALVAVVGGISVRAGLTHAPTVTARPMTLTVPAEGSDRCAAVGVDVLRGMHTAFEGTATSVKDGRVELRVDHWYRGGDAPTVRLRTAAHQPQLSGVNFETGRRYLVTADKGQVSLCGASAEADPHLRRLYDLAFPPVSPK
ncbi:hypothetical protein [Streptomyces gibsoniae]|uniref:Anti-sigma factor n=1 Tax=Streptomyces gibsoniae TaxID=3075529 RepID=A0ABU2TSI7_9ACTN|nr:hypothetical protein [Streptomyces sp. DSM 41699]MDT0463886.1 hypothetical protein [Streptomyces sp. DSM 41699]